MRAVRPFLFWGFARPLATPAGLPSVGQPDAYGADESRVFQRLYPSSGRGGNASGVASEEARSKSAVERWRNGLGRREAGIGRPTRGKGSAILLYYKE